MRLTIFTLVSVCLFGSVAPAQDAYVPNQGADTLTIFDIRNPANRVTRLLGDQPHEGVFTLDGRYIFVSNRLDNNLSVYDATSRTEVDTDGNLANGITRISVGSQPHGVAVTPDNRYIFVSNDGSNDVSVIEIATLQLVSTVPNVGIAPHVIAIRPDGKEAWTGNVAGGDVSLIDVEKAIGDPANAVICATPGGAGATCRIPAGSGTEGVAFTKDGRTAYAANGGANTVTVIDVESRTVLANLAVGGGPRRVHLTPDGSRAYVSQLVGSEMAVIDTSTHQLVPAETIDNIDTTLGMEFRADGGRLYVANFFSSPPVITEIELPDTDQRTTHPVGANPDSVVLQPEEVRGLHFQADRDTLAWQIQYLAQAYNVYRGDLAALPDYGSCRNADDPDLTDTRFADLDSPAPGAGFFYLVSIAHDGFEGVLGRADDGQLRLPAIGCLP